MVKLSNRTKSITTKVTADEHARLESLAVASGQTVSEWVRTMLLRQPEQCGDRALLAELRIPAEGDHDSWMIPITIPA